MVRLNIRRKKSGVPILSKDQIDDIGEALVADFCPEAMRYPQPINIDLFAQDYLQMEMDYQYLSHCGIYLGMTVFNDTNKVVVYDPDKNRAEYISAKAGTIIIDNNLLEEKQEHRYRFTMGHEAPGHGILHKEYFHYDPNQLTLFDMSDKVMIQCRTDGKQKRKKDQRFWTDIDWMEWQADGMSAATLMPKKMVLLVVNDRRPHLLGQTDEEAAHNLADHVSDVFNVSSEAAFYRLRSLGLINKSITFEGRNYGSILEGIRLFNDTGKIIVI